MRAVSSAFVAGLAVVTVAQLTTAASAGGLDGRPSGVRSLVVGFVATPVFRLPNYETRGSIPHVSVSDGRVQLGAVNRALRAIVVRDQNEYAKRASRYASRKRLSHGLYQTRPRMELLSASSSVVSALIP